MVEEGGWLSGAGWALGLVWIGPENLASTGVGTLDHPACGN